MKIKEVVATLERFAPLPLQESYDNAGLQIGLTEAEDVSGVLLCLDVTEKVIEEAEREGCNLIVAHHPLLFRPLRRIAGTTQPERCAAMAIKKNVAVYAAHTNLDNVRGGVCHMMAERIGLQQVRFLRPSADEQSGSGVLGTLPHAEPAECFLKRVKQTFGIEALHYASGPQQAVSRVALCGGAGDFLIDDAVRAGAHVFLTGEVGYHRFFGHEGELWLAAMGHFESERFTVDLLERLLKAQMPGLKVKQTALTVNPVRVM